MTIRALALAAVTAVTLPGAASAQDFINILTGGTSGVYYPMGVALSKIWGETMPEARIQVQATKASVENGSLDQSVLDDIGWAVYPAVDESKPAAPPYGGINLGISSKGNNVDLAYQAAECIVSPENQTEYFVSNGNPASNTTAFDHPAVSEAFPMASTIRDSLQQAAPRPQTPYYNEISLGIQSTWHPPGADNADTTPAQSQSFILQVLRGERLL